MQRPPAEKRRISIPEILLTMIVGSGLVAGIYGIYKLASRDQKISAAIAQIKELHQLDMTSTDGSLRNAWDQKITSIRQDGALVIASEHVPALACPQLATVFSSSDEDFVRLQIGEMIMGEGFEEQNSQNITQACGTAETVTMTWSFK